MPFGIFLQPRESHTLRCTNPSVKESLLEQCHGLMSCSESASLTWFRRIAHRIKEHEAISTDICADHPLRRNRCRPGASALRVCGDDASGHGIAGGVAAAGAVVKVPTDRFLERFNCRRMFPDDFGTHAAFRHALSKSAKFLTKRFGCSPLRLQNSDVGLCCSS